MKKRARKTTARLLVKGLAVLHLLWFLPLGARADDAVEGDRARHMEFGDCCEVREAACSGYFARLFERDKARAGDLDKQFAEAKTKEAKAAADRLAEYAKELERGDREVELSCRRAAIRSCMAKVYGR